MSEPAKGAWKVIESPQPAEELYVRQAVLPAAAQVVEMPTSPGEPPCIYVRGEGIAFWGVQDTHNYDVAYLSEAQARKEIEARLMDGPPGRELKLFCAVVIETRTKDAAGE